MRWLLKSPSSRLFAQPFVQTQINENIKAPRHWPLWGESTGHRWILLQRASNAEIISISWRHHAMFWLYIIILKMLWNKNVSNKWCQVIHKQRPVEFRLQITIHQCGLNKKLFMNGYISTWLHIALIFKNTSDFSFFWYKPFFVNAVHSYIKKKFHGEVNTTRRTHVNFIDDSSEENQCPHITKSLQTGILIIRRRKCMKRNHLMTHMNCVSTNSNRSNCFWFFFILYDETR